MSNKSEEIKKRKKDHIKIATSDEAQTGDAGFSKYRFIHNALPEIDFDKIDTSVKFLGKKVAHPFFISCMTGGVAEGQKLNRNLAKAAQKKNIAMGVGSQRAAVEHPKLAKLFQVRKYAPDIPVIANVGLVQLNYGFGIDEIKKIVDMVEADAIAFHINPIQEVIQPEGDRNFEDLLPKFEKIIKKIKTPVIVKEVGFGLSEDVVRRLYDIGVRIFDTAGWGGTSWSVVEGKRRPGWEDMGELFGDWGIPTTQSIKMCVSFKKSLDTVHRSQVTILGSGGVRNGVDIAKSITLGADLVGIAAPFGKVALDSSDAVADLINRLVKELKTTMFGVGVKNISSLKKVKFQSA